MKNKRDKNKKRRKHKKDDSSDPSSIDDSDSYYVSDYRHKRCKRKSNQKKIFDQIMRTFNRKVSDNSV